MHDAMLWILLIVEQFSTSLSISCYSCITPLPETIPRDAQIALRTILNTHYNLPSVEKYCDNPKDVFFRGVPQDDCPPGDQCVKVSALAAGRSFEFPMCFQNILNLPS